MHCFGYHFTMPHLSKRQKQVNSLLRKRGRFASQAVNIKKRVYTKTSRTTNWRRNKKKKDQKEDMMGKKTVDILLNDGISATTSSLLQQSQAIDTMRLYTRLEEVNKQCVITKSSKASIPTYDYMRLMSISRFIQLLLDKKGKIDASNQIAQTLWNKGNYMARCIRKWGNHYIETGKLSTIVMAQKKCQSRDLWGGNRPATTKLLVL